MADRVLTAEMILSGKDAGVSDMLARIVKNIDAVSKQASHTAEVQKLGKSLADLDRQMASVDKMATAQSGFTVMHERALAAAAGVDKLKTDIAGVAAPTAAMTKALAAAEAASTKASVAALRQAEAVTKAEHAVAAMSIPTDHAAITQERLAKAFSDTARAAESAVIAERNVAEASRVAAAAEREHHKALERRQELISSRGFAHYGVQAAAGALAAHSLVHGEIDVARQGAEIQHERTEMLKAGIQAPEINSIQSRSLELATKYENITQLQMMEMAKEVRSVMTDPSEMMEMLEPLAKAKSLLDARDPSGEGSHGLGLLIKGAENIGAAKDPKRLEKLIDGYMKAMQVMGGTIRPEDIYDYDKLAKLGGARLSDRFLMTTAQSLSQELTGSTAGKATGQLYKQISGGMQNLHSAAKEFARIGMIDPRNLDHTKTGEIKGTKAGVRHPVKGDELAATDPDLWTWNVLQPMLRKAHITKQADQLAWVQKAFPNSGVADLIGKFIVQRPSYESHAKQFGGASGLEGQSLNADDPLAGIDALGKSLETFAGVLTSPIMKDAGHGLDALSGLIGQASERLAAFDKDHPEAAKALAVGAGVAGLAIAGTASAAVLTGFGLPTAATHLEASAIALDAAAEKIGVGGVAGNAVNAAENAAGGGLGAMGIFGRLATGLGIAGVGMFVADAMLNRRDPSKAMVDGGVPDVHPWDNNLGLPGTGEDGPSDPTEAAKRAAEMARGAAASAGSAWDWVTSKAKSLGFGDRLHDEVSGVPLPPPRPGDRGLPAVVPAPVGALTFHPDDDDRLTRARASDAASWLEELGRKERESVFTLGQLDTAAARAAMSLVSLASFGSGSGGDAGGGGIIRASYGGGLGGGSADDGSPVVGGAGTVDKALPKEARAFLDTISSGEAHGYNILNGGGTFGDLSHHPGGRAAGRYQDLPSTWKRISGALGLHDFSPGSQDKGNWWLAQQDYRAHTGRDLLGDLRSRDPARVAAIGRALHSTWVSTNGSFARKYDHYLGVQGEEHPALAAPPLPRRSVPHSNAPMTSAHNELVGAVRQMTAAVERGGLHRFHVALDKGLTGKKTYQRGAVGATIA